MNTSKYFGEGSSNPLQYSCLEGPMGGGAWWAAVHGVAQSRTWLKRLSSSSSKYLQYGNTVLSFGIFKHLILIFEMEIVTIPIYRQRIKAQRVHVFVQGHMRQSWDSNWRILTSESESLNFFSLWLMIREWWTYRSKR